MTDTVLCVCWLRGKSTCNKWHHSSVKLRSDNFNKYSISYCPSITNKPMIVSKRHHHFWIIINWILTFSINQKKNLSMILWTLRKCRWERHKWVRHRWARHRWVRRRFMANHNQQDNYKAVWNTVSHKTINPAPISDSSRWVTHKWEGLNMPNLSTVNHNMATPSMPPPNTQLLKSVLLEGPWHRVSWVKVLFSTRRINKNIKMSEYPLLRISVLLIDLNK